MNSNKKKPIGQIALGVLVIGLLCLFVYIVSGSGSIVSSFQSIYNKF